MRAAVFLDRDGVINIDTGYVATADEFEFVPGVLEACAQLVAKGYALVVVTNQSGIARGFYDEQAFSRLTDWMRERFAAAGAPLTAVYYCPHHPDKGVDRYRRVCDCRKPEPGMLLRAMAEHGLDPQRSIMVGDKASDMVAASRAGIAQRILVRTGKPLSADAIAESTFQLDSLAQLPTFLTQFD